jgi:hypothetical protein
MGGSYRQCRECGKRALSIATRCPGCGRELEPLEATKPAPRLELGRYVSPGVAGLLVLGAVVIAVEIGGTSRPEDQRRSMSAEVSDSAAGSAEVAYAMGGTAHLDRSSVEETPDSAAGEYLVARTWTNVRKSRSTRGDLEAVLTPGDTVYADSLQRDWYRVAFEGEVMGYAHRSTLTAP